MRDAARSCPAPRPTRPGSLVAGFLLTLLVTVGCDGAVEPAAPDDTASGPDPVAVTSSEPARSDSDDGTSLSTEADPDAGSTTSREAGGAQARSTEPPATEDPSEEEPSEDEPTAHQTDWLNTAYTLRHSPGADPETFTLVDGTADSVSLVGHATDPADPARAAAVFTGRDGEGYALFVGVGIYRADGTGGTSREAGLTTMEDWAIQADQCPATVSWDGADTVTVDMQPCEHWGPEPQTRQWERTADTFAAPQMPVAAPLDVSGFDIVDFASPSGRIICTMNSQPSPWAACHFPEEMDRTGVPGRDFCGEHIGLHGVGVSQSNGWVCTGGTLAVTTTNSHTTSWFQNTGWEPVPDPYGNPENATVPYGAALSMGPITCSSARDGIRCENESTGAGFKLALAGVERYGPQAPRFDWGQ